MSFHQNTAGTFTQEVKTFLSEIYHSAKLTTSDIRQALRGDNNLRAIPQISNFDREAAKLGVPVIYLLLASEGFKFKSEPTAKQKARLDKALAYWKNIDEEDLREAEFEEYVAERFVSGNTTLN